MLPSPFFFLSSLCIPGAATIDFLGTVKRRNVVFSTSVVLLTDVQPLLACNGPG
jgi:hypothetical protein